LAHHTELAPVPVLVLIVFFTELELKIQGLHLQVRQILVRLSCEKSVEFGDRDRLGKRPVKSIVTIGVKTCV
jgi:hypothetical protein